MCRLSSYVALSDQVIWHYGGVWPGGPLGWGVMIAGVASLMEVVSLAGAGGAFGGSGARSLRLGSR